MCHVCERGWGKCEASRMQLNLRYAARMKCQVFYLWSITFPPLSYYFLFSLSFLLSYPLSPRVFHPSSSVHLSSISNPFQYLSYLQRERERWYHAGITAIQFWYPPSAVETERMRGAGRQTVGTRQGDVKSSKGEIISTSCTVYPPQSISSSCLFSFSMWRESFAATTSPTPPSQTCPLLSLFLPLPLSLSLPCFWYSRHTAFSRWSNSFAAATSRPFSPRQPSISYWCASKRGGREGGGRRGWRWTSM